MNFSYPHWKYFWISDKNNRLSCFTFCSNFSNNRAINLVGTKKEKESFTIKTEAELLVFTFHLHAP